MIGTTLLQHYKNNYYQWKKYKALPQGYKRSDGMFPSETYFKYPPNYSFGGKKVLNLGCGRSVYPFVNVINADVVPGEYIYVIDPSRPLTQFGRDFDFIIANHVLEHIPGWFEKFQELAQMLKPGGILEIWTPPDSADTSRTFRDHINSIGIRSFDGVGPNASGGSNVLATHEFERYTDVKKLQMVQYSIRPIITWWTLLAPPSVLKWMIQHLRNIASEEQYIFQKLP